MALPLHKEAPLEMGTWASPYRAPAEGRVNLIGRRFPPTALKSKTLALRKPHHDRQYFPRSSLRCSIAAAAAALVPKAAAAASNGLAGQIRRSGDAAA